VPGVVFGATVIVPSAFIVRLPLVGAGAVPGVSITLLVVAAVVPTVSLSSTLGVAPPATEPIGPNVSSTASIIGVATQCGSFAAQLVGGFVQADPLVVQPDGGVVVSSVITLTMFVPAGGVAATVNVKVALFVPGVVPLSAGTLMIVIVHKAGPVIVPVQSVDAPLKAPANVAVVFAGISS
jgi:hypothetical protein